MAHEDAIDLTQGSDDGDVPPPRPPISKRAAMKGQPAPQPEPPVLPPAAVLQRKARGEVAWHVVSG